MTTYQRHRVICSLAVIMLFVIPARGQAPAVPDPGSLGPTLAGQNTVPASAGVDVQDAGLAPGATPQSLTLQRAYALALARHRAQLSQPTAGAGQKQDLRDLDRLIRDTSFATFRQELLSRDRPFADPSADFFDLVGHQQRVANAKNRMADLNIFKAFLQKRIEARIPG